MYTLRSPRTDRPSLRRVGAAAGLAAALAALSLLSFALVIVPTPPQAQALCAAQPIQGDWRNINSNTRSATRVVVGLACGDQVLCDEDGNCTGGDTYYTLRTFGKCSPSDCDWGVRRATAMANGWQRAIYHYSWATKYVWVKTYPRNNRTYLRVWIRTDFAASDGRTDYTTDEWMLK